MMSNSSSSAVQIAWRPTPEYIDAAGSGAFISKHGLSRLDELMTRSTTDLEWFWRAVLDDLGIEFYEPYRRVVDPSRGHRTARNGASAAA